MPACTGACTGVCVCVYVRISGGGGRRSSGWATLWRQLHVTQTSADAHPRAPICVVRAAFQMPPPPSAAHIHKGLTLGARREPGGARGGRPANSTATAPVLGPFTPSPAKPAEPPSPSPSSQTCLLLPALPWHTICPSLFSPPPPPAPTHCLHTLAPSLLTHPAVASPAAPVRRALLRVVAAAAPSTASYPSAPVGSPINGAPQQQQQRGAAVSTAPANIFSNLEGMIMVRACS